MRTDRGRCLGSALPTLDASGKQEGGQEDWAVLHINKGTVSSCMCIASEGNYFHVAHVVFPFLGDFLSSSELTTILFFCLLACLCTYQSFNSGVCRLPTPSLKVFMRIGRTTDFIILNGPTRVSGPGALGGDSVLCLAATSSQPFLCHHPGMPFPSLLHGESPSPPSSVSLCVPLNLHL